MADYNPPAEHDQPYTLRRAIPFGRGRLSEVRVRPVNLGDLRATAGVGSFDSEEGLFQKVLELIPRVTALGANADRLDFHDVQALGELIAASLDPGEGAVGSGREAET